MSAAASLALGLAAALTPLIAKAAGALRLFDAPGEARRMHQMPVPRLGGVAVYLVAAFVASMLFVYTSPIFVTNGPVGDAQIKLMTGVFLGSALLFLVGLVDDLRGLSPITKSFAQVVAAGIVYYFGFRIDAGALGYGPGVPPGVLEIPAFERGDALKR